MHSTSVYGLKLSVLEGAGEKVYVLNEATH